MLFEITFYVFFIIIIIIIIIIIPCFHSRGQLLFIIYLFIGTKESVYIRKEFNSTGLVWDINMAAVSLFWDTNMAAMTSCENTQLSHI